MKKFSMNMAPNKNMVELTIQSVAYGGMGIARCDKLVYFVETTLPNERVLAEIIERKKSYVIAKPIKIITPSPDRIMPPCEYFLLCGGCSYLHTQYESQLKLKKQQIYDIIERIAKIKDPPVEKTIASPQTFNYRNRITLHRRTATGPTIGFFSVDNKTLIPIEHCLIAHESINNEMLLVRKMDAAKKLNLSKISEISLTCDKNVTTTLFTQKRTYHNNDCCYTRLNETQEIVSSNIPTLPATSGTKTKPFLSFRFKKLNILYSPYTFFQTNTEMLHILCEKLCEDIGEEVKTLIDAYCGVGIFSLILSDKCVKVIGIEENAASERMARRNLSKNKISNVTFLNKRVEPSLGPILKENSFSRCTLLLDPPRSGLSYRVIKSILFTPPQRIIYISCEPTTLARDLLKLSPLYTIKNIIPFDMFPHTKHVEVMTVLMRK
ncbi:23S rRNA (uracil(1939)-C(5))-methyltransferase RlmD [Candidatus Omnitrophota bacterium]